MPDVKAGASADIKRHWDYLCTEIGERRAGGAGDHQAGDYVLNEFRALGLSNVHAESFVTPSVITADVALSMGTGSKLTPVGATVLSGSPSTRGQRPIETDLVWIEMPEQASRLFNPALRGRIAVLVGPMPTRADLHRKLVKCGPAAVIHVDDRLPFEWVKDDGVYPAWARLYGMPPTVTIPYRTAWELRQAGANRARIQTKVLLEPRTCHNLVGEIPGRKPGLPVILLGAHHDTQCNNVGADDNASGVVSLLVLARHLVSSRPLRTIRFVSFGAEEQLSVGSAHYVGRHRRKMREIGIVLNLDSVSSPLGHHWLLRAGTDAFGDWLQQRLARHGLDVVQKPEPMPFADHFPFSAFGVPSVTFMRPNMDGGMRWQHHSAQDDLSNVSVEEVQKIVRGVGGVVFELARSAKWKFPRGMAPEFQKPIRLMARDMFGLRGSSRH